MIKASEGGGGKGIRKVESEDQFCNQFRQVSSEAVRNRCDCAANRTLLCSASLQFVYAIVISGIRCIAITSGAVVARLRLTRLTVVYGAETAMNGQ